MERVSVFMQSMAAAGVVGIACLVAPSSVWAVQAFQESAGQVVMETEHPDANIARGGQSWTLETTTAGFSGSGYMNALPNLGLTIDTNYTTTSPELSFNVQFATTGTYYIWVRGLGATDDTAHAGIDGTGPVSASKLSGFTTSWNWKSTTLNPAVPRPTVTVTTPGLHTIHLWMREDGFKADKMLLRTDSSTTAPSGTGPAESARVTVGGDTTAPTVSLSAPAAGSTVAGASVTVSATASDNVGVVGVQFKLDGANLGAEDTASPYSTSWNTTTATNGSHSLTAVARDAAGNTATSAAVTVTVDNAAPVISSTASSNITSTAATITWTTNEASTSQVDYGPTTSYGQSTTLNATLVTSHTTSLSGLSAATLYHYRVRSKDAPGNEAVGTDATFTTTAPADTTPPTGTVTINSGAASTNTTTVTLTLSATDNSGTISQMQFSNDGVTYSTPEAYATTKAWTLSAGDGTKTVSVKFRDAAGNWSAAAADTIVLDTTAPTISLVSASSLTQTAATVSWTTNEAATSQVDYGTTTSYGQTSPLDTALVTSHSVSLSGLTAGTLYHARVRSKDAAGNEALSADTTFTTTPPTDTTPPSGSITINNGAAGTNTLNVTLTLSATDNSGTVAQMQFSNDGTTYSAPEAYATTKAWTLTTGDGTKTVYAKFKDAAGNWSSPVSDTIVLDTTPPTIGFISPKDRDVLIAPSP